MKRIAVAALLLLPLMASGAFAVENDNPNAAQTGDLPKKYPAAMKALHGILPKNMQGEDWLWNLNGVGMALMDKDVGGVHYIAGWGCKPKFCAQNIVGFLVTADGKKAIAEISISSKPQYLGKPSAAEKKALDGLIN
ncbi:Ivy family c-type lysozyme inhibitor [Aestuariivirga litoralis]|uniref:Ivy family c-type lysozyme inhibitor n=1 Tax=Aestuariivirga litoralis TaxID=2650924 RepID=UPI0018C84F1D|nr:Ivy family c-type lysozyme inhibitor [Aestuariivirga litoralis]MBG1233629.1 hypothetical protein [Aestuariivirga litoralis]